MVTINGKFLARSINGQIRVAKELIYKLDEIVQCNEFEIVAPYSKYDIKGLKHIKVIRYGKGNPHIWEQTYFFYYLIRNERTGVNFLNSHPILKPDICYIHDVLFRACPKLHKSLYGNLSSKWNRLMFYSAAKKAKVILTVSEFSKREIMNYYSVSQNKIYVIYNAWQHMNRIQEDNAIFLRYPQIKRKDYCLAVSGITPQKNFSWILKNAEYNTKKLYVIVGKYEGTSLTNLTECEPKNVLYTGQLSDREMKALMKECWLFIHPAIYEGFGMTPLEAIASGATRIAVSNSACLPEIYKDTAFYIDPYDPFINLDLLVRNGKQNVKKILDFYSWEKAAKELYKIIYRYL